jgi:hypothetical protein
MDWLAAGEYEVARAILQRGVALVYVLAFVNVLAQFRPLLGEAGLLPVPAYLARSRFREAPSLFHAGYSDRRLTAVGVAGVVLAVGIAVGVLELVPVWASIVWWLALWGLYLSVVNVGQLFYGFGWESLLLEAGFYAAFLGTASVAPPLLVLFLFRWLLFRVEFGAGMIKLRGDRCWRDLTCLDYHHETQPMPNPLSRWFHLLPRWAHRTEVAANHAAQLVAPFLLLAPQPVAGIGAAVMVATQAYLMLSGNYAWLNLLTLLLGFSAIPDAWYGEMAASLGSSGAGVPAWMGWVVMAVTALVVVLSYRPVRNLATGRQLMNFSFNRYHLVNTYGAFGSVTRRRREVVIEGADHPSGRWRAYEFKGKPTDPRRRPRQWAPHHLRLDWQMWFVALSPAYGRGWLDRFVGRLLEGDRATLSLLARDPFDGSPPRWIRGRIVDYRFATRAERRATGAIWITGESRVLFDPVGGPAG